MKVKANQFIILVVNPVFFLIAACTGTDSTDTPETQPTTTSSLEIATVEPPEPPSLEIDQPDVETVLFEGEVATRTPKPTISPGLFEDGSYNPNPEICHQIESIMRAHSQSCAPVVED